MDMDNSFKLGRRQFLGTAAGTFTLGFALDLLGPSSEAQAQVAGTVVNSWLSVDAANNITLTIGSSDMGQGSFAGLAQILSEDLMVDYTKLQLVQGGPTLTSPAPVGTAILTGGSGVTRNNFITLRNAGASARETLVAAAIALNPGSTRADFSVTNGVVYFNGVAAYTYGQLAATAATLTPVAVTTAQWVPDAQLKLIGKSVPRLDIPAKVYGTAQYGIDVRLPGMVYAVVKHCPTVGGTLAATPAKPTGALAVVPVKVVGTVTVGTSSFTTSRGAEAAGNVNAVAVVASTTWDAMQGANAVKPTWTLPAAASTWSTTQFLAGAKALATATAPAGLWPVEASGDAATAYAAATKKLDVTYTLPFVPHACMEVLNCTVDYKAGVGCTVYAPTQGAKSVLQLVMAMTGMTESQVKIKTTLLGGGLGRKIELDYVSQAVQVGMALGIPVQLVWPREQDLTHGQYRPMAVIRARAGLDASNYINSFIYRNVSPSIRAQRLTAGALTAADGNAYEGSKDLPYTFTTRQVEWVHQPTPIPVGYWRSVGASLNTFAVESLMDELAAAAAQDPYQFRRRFLGTNPRWLAVLDAAATLGGWSSTVPTGSARGIAIGAAFNSIVACVVEISGVTKDTLGNITGVKISKVAVAIDSYLTINPKNVEAQIVGGVVHGINATLYGQQTFVNGAAQRANFNTHPVIRLSAMPTVAVTIMPTVSYQPASSTSIGGVGELGVPTVAPALANAIFKLTGQRKRDLPLLPTATMGGI